MEWNMAKKEIKEVEIKSNLELPYMLIDIKEGNEQFTLYFKSFDEHQSVYSINAGGVTGVFEVAYSCLGMDCRFECDITMGNLYSFYLQLENVYECLPGIVPFATLENYGSLEHTNLTFKFDKLGHVKVNGRFMNKEAHYNSGIVFDVSIDAFYNITYIINSLKYFFEEIKRIQGHSNFY